MRIPTLLCCGWLLALAGLEAADAPKQSKPLGDLIALKKFPDSQSISNIQLVADLNVAHGGTMDAVQFRQMLKEAKPAPPDVASNWHFAPWYRGSFTHNGKDFGFRLYLGGLALLTQPDGKKGLLYLKHAGGGKR